MKNYHFILLFFLCFSADVQAQKIQLLQQDTATSIRGLSVVDNQVAWASGSRGHVAITTNGGKNWNWQQVKGFEKSDFRDVEAFSAKEAIIMSSGTPALILKTTNGGVNWQVVYRNDDKAWFLDDMTFVSKKHGYVLGDPIAGKFVLLETKDKAGKQLLICLQQFLMKQLLRQAEPGLYRNLTAKISILLPGAKFHAFLFIVKENFIVNRFL